jgi:hypothetical protein
MRRRYLFPFTDPARLSSAFSHSQTLNFQLEFTALQSSWPPIYPETLALGNGVLTLSRAYHDWMDGFVYHYGFTFLLAWLRVGLERVYRRGGLE